MRAFLTIGREKVFGAARQARSAKEVPVLAGLTRKTGRGQSCKSGCGCVTDFELGLDGDGVVRTASFQAKQVLLDQFDRPLLTMKGRAMFRSCECDVVRGLVSEAVAMCENKHIDTLRNAMVLAPHAPAPFLRALSRNLGLSQEHTGCLQVVESALITALTDRTHATPPMTVAAIWFPLGGSPAVTAETRGGAPATTAAMAAAAGSARGAAAAAAAAMREGESEIDFREQYKYA